MSRVKYFMSKYCICCMSWNVFKQFWSDTRQFFFSLKLRLQIRKAIWAFKSSCLFVQLQNRFQFWMRKNNVCLRKAWFICCSMPRLRAFAKTTPLVLRASWELYLAFRTHFLGAIRVWVFYFHNSSGSNWISLWTFWLIGEWGKRDKGHPTMFACLTIKRIFKKNQCWLSLIIVRMFSLILNEWRTF